MSDETKRKFTKLTEAEQAEFLELTKDCFDPELHTEDDLPWLRANRKRWEEEQRQGQETTASDESSEELDEDLEPPSDSSDPWRWDYLE
jgi:hypothetical protein